MLLRHLTKIDQLLIESDKAMRTVFGHPAVSDRAHPADDLAEPELSNAQRQLAMRLMRVNHAGEVSAQALYHGQSLTADLPDVRETMERAALEEGDHLAWCAQRVHELGGHTSLLNPVWYAGSFAIGAIAGKIGDKWSLGFVAETETQVVKHLDQHLAKLSEDDTKSRAILEQMKQDEDHHRQTAVDHGGAVLPKPVTQLMSLVSKVMTSTSYRV